MMLLQQKPKVVRRPPIDPTEGQFPALPDLEDFDLEVLRCVDFAAGRTKHAARHALHHLSRAWAIRHTDPEMAAFRALTAEEEAATALFICLRQLGYQNSARLNFRRHDFKAAAYPFMRAVWNLFTELGPALPFTLQLAAVTAEERRVLEIRLLLPTGAYLSPLPPLNFRVGEGEDSLPYRFTKQLGELARNSGKDAALDHIREVANLRNILLYAGDNGWASIANDIDDVVRGYQERVLVMLRVLCLIFPYQEHALFVDQCIDAFLVMMGVIQDESQSDLAAVSRQEDG